MKQWLSFCMKTRGHLQGAPFRGLIKIQCLLPLREMWFYSFCLLASMKIVDNNSLLGAKQETAWWHCLKRQAKRQGQQSNKGYLYSVSIFGMEYTYEWVGFAPLKRCRKKPSRSWCSSLVKKRFLTLSSCHNSAGRVNAISCNNWGSVFSFSNISRLSNVKVL